MSLPVTLLRSNVTLAVEPDGDVFANGMRVTRDGGWLDVRTLASALAQGAPVLVSLQLRVVATEDGRAGLQVASVVAGAQTFASVPDVDAAWAEFWRASLDDALRAEIDRVLNGTGRRTRPMAAVAVNPVESVTRPVRTRERRKTG